MDYHLDPEGNFSNICNLLSETGIQDGRSEETAHELNIDGKLTRKYILNFIRYGKVSFKNKTDAENTLTICEDLGLPLAEEYICKEVLKIDSRKERMQLQESKAARVNSIPLDEMEKVLGHFVKIEGGTFLMGSPDTELNRDDDERQHAVTLSDFELGEVAVTQEGMQE